MRVSTPYQFGTYLTNIQTAQAKHFKVETQIATGKRFQNASEDPLAATLSMDARRLMGRFEQFDKNLRGARDFLNNSEVALEKISNLTRSAYTKAIQGASDAVSQSEREALAREVADLRTQLLTSANAKGSNGQYIFAGQDTGNQPFTESGGVITYNGDAGVIQVEVRSSEFMPANLVGFDTEVVDVYDALVELENNLLSGDVTALSNESIEKLDRLVDRVAGVRGEVGSRLNRVNEYASENQRRIDDLTIEISDLEDIDIAEATVRYEEAQLAYQAALQVASRGMNLSLLDYL